MSEKEIKKMIDQGFQDAKNTVAMGEGVSFERIIEFHKHKKAGQSRLGDMSFGEFVEAVNSGVFDNKTDLFTQ